jgi:DNA-binding transcriptional MocR family regulator
MTSRDPLPDDAAQVTGIPEKDAPMDDLDADYTPRYIWLARLLPGRIEDGTYPPGSLLPSSARLAQAHTVSKATARHALGVLVKTGHARHVESKPHQVIWRLADHVGKAR